MYRKSNSLSFIAMAAAVALLVLLAFIPAWAQNPVPPTAREAAASPAFAPKLHPATRPATNKPRAVTSAGRPSPQDGVLYENGPVNGSTDAWTINFGYVVSDTFYASVAGSVGSFDIYVWEFPGDVLSSLQWSITSSPNGGTVYGSGWVSNLTDRFISTNQYGYNIDQISATIQGAPVPSGISWLNLFNATVPSGDPVFWDENSGVGCHSNGCPSQAYESAAGTIPSEAFDINGGCRDGCPSCFQSGENLEIIYNFTGKEGGIWGAGGPWAGVVTDAAGNVYGAVGDIVYQIVSTTQGWLFNTLYNFNGGTLSYAPIIGPDRALYGAAWDNSGRNGFVYSLRPSPTPCVSSSCPWIESVVSHPFGNNDIANPGGLVFDQEGNLYGTTTSGGAYGKGAVFELTPSGGNWTETILYSFTGGNDGNGPESLLVGIDGNLYGTTGWGGAYSSGVVFQLVRPPSGGNWTENVIYSFTGGSDGGGPYSLVQDGVGDLYGLAGSVLEFMLTPSRGNWVFSVVGSFGTNWSSWSTTYLAVDAIGDVYWANGWYELGCGDNCASPMDVAAGGVGVLGPPPIRGGGALWGSGWDIFFPSGALGVDANGNVYGTTGGGGAYGCGKYGKGTVWKVSH
jgi:uncharacterized repeat protein (TIGR03803 family)